MFTISSPAFKNNEKIPRTHTGQGDDVSPELNWNGAPENTQEFAIICDDPDAPSAEPWVHWVIYKIPGSVTKIPSTVPTQQTVAFLGDALQGQNSWGTIGYRGPMPPPGSGNHHYYFTIFAIDQALDLKPGLSKKELLKKLEGHILGKSAVVGIYSR